MFERRCEKRAALDITFSVYLGRGRTILAQAVDLSSRGLRFQHLGPGVTQGEAVLVQFSLGKETYSFCGKPLRVRMAGSFVQEVALSFVGSDPQTRRRLESALLS